MRLKLGVILVLVGVFVCVAFRVGWGEQRFTGFGLSPTGRIVLREARPAGYDYTTHERRNKAVSEIAFPARYSDLAGLSIAFVGALVVSLGVVARFESTAKRGDPDSRGSSSNAGRLPN